MQLKVTQRFLHKNGEPRKFYSCERWPACNATHGAHPDGRPLGVPGDKETKLWRVRAHAAFDQLWNKGRLSRKESYKFLQFLMSMTKNEAHIAKFDRRQCEKLIQTIECGIAEAELEKFLSERC